MADSKYTAVLDKDLVLKHYSQPHVIQAILESSKNKEVAGSFGGTGYAKRPDTLRFTKDIIAQINQGVTSFHVSEETWKNPYALSPGMSQIQTQKLRIGWDLILDIDCAIFEYSKIAAHLLVQALKHHDIQAISVKFSGNHGFHIAIPFESFPKTINNIPIEHLFPQAARTIAEYLKNQIVPLQSNDESSLSYNILKYEMENNNCTIDQALEIIKQKTDLNHEQLTTKQKNKEGHEIIAFNAFNILAIDTILISSRHLVRHVYAINEKSGLVSIPINPSKILQFERDIAKLENFVESKYIFLDRAVARAEEAKALFTKAFEAEHSSNIIVYEQKEQKEITEYEQITQAIPEMYFAPSIKQLSQGIKDGKKRGVFVLINFLGSVGWNDKQIEEYIYAWNKKNPEPLKEAYLQGQLRAGQGKKVLPPNYDAPGYYEGIDTAKEIAMGIKNPVTFTTRMFKQANPDKPKKEELTEAQKEARRKYRAKKKEGKE